MFTFDAKFYKRNAVLDEHPWYLIPSKWMAKAHDEEFDFLSTPEGDGYPPAILHSCMQSPYNASGNFGDFLKEDIDHDFRCKKCLMRPSDKMITLFTLLK